MHRNQSVFLTSFFFLKPLNLFRKIVNIATLFKTLFFGMSEKKYM